MKCTPQALEVVQMHARLCPSPFSSKTLDHCYSFLTLHDHENKMMPINSISVPLLANCFRQVKRVYKQIHTNCSSTRGLRGEEKQRNKKG
ncbi:hypothetical protein VNO77_24113 [Canavalia gladiata]|uniref:Uncharacterized protein n=1 Tax=Canavalia gladiata TaxID=3824 RepID=A0AAN9QC66_CANGL